MANLYAGISPQRGAQGVHYPPYNLSMFPLERGPPKAGISPREERRGLRAGSPNPPTLALRGLSQGPPGEKRARGTGMHPCCPATSDLTAQWEEKAPGDGERPAATQPPNFCHLRLAAAWRRRGSSPIGNPGPTPSRVDDEAGGWALLLPEPHLQSLKGAGARAGGANPQNRGFGPTFGRLRPPKGFGSLG